MNNVNIDSLQVSTSETSNEVIKSSNPKSKYKKCNMEFFKAFLFLQIIGTLMLVFSFILTIKYFGGFSWSDVDLRFNFHPICMILGMIYFSGNSILAFRILRNQPKQLVKIVHATLHVIAFCVSLFGSIAVLTNHLIKNIPDFYTLHSWIGALTMTLFFLQYIGGFYNFLFPTTSRQLRAFLLPYHVLGGFAIFLLAVASCLTGINEKAIFKDPLEYKRFGGYTFVTNITGILILFFGFSVIFLGTEKKFKKVVNPEQLPLAQNKKEEK